MRGPLAILLVSLLAGCIEGQPATIEDAPPMTRLETVDVGFEAFAYGDGFCAIILCWNTMERPWPQENLAANTSLSSIDVRMTFSEDPERPVWWQIECVIDGRSCSGVPLAEVKGADSPLHIQLDAATPPGATILHRFGFRSPNHPAEDAMASRSVTVDGAYGLEIDLTMPVVPSIERTVPFRHEGVTAPCVFVAEPDCISYPGGTELEMGPFPEGRAAGIGLRLEWNAGTPITKELTVSIDCRIGFNLCPGIEPVEFTGPSPLVVDSMDLDHPQEASVLLVVYEPEVAGVFPSTTRQPYVLSGEVRVNESGGARPA